MLRERQMEIEVSDAAKDWLSHEGFSEAYGARPLKRVIQDQLLKPLSIFILSNDVVEGSCVTVDYDYEQSQIKFDWHKVVDINANTNTNDNLNTQIDANHAITS